MDAANLIALVSAVIAALSLFLAAFQHFDAKRRVQTERERLAAQEERLKTAVAAATLGMHSADLIVQRAKEDDVTLPEVQNMARGLRGSLAVLARQIADEGDEIAARTRGEQFRSARGSDLDLDTGGADLPQSGEPR